MKLRSSFSTLALCSLAILLFSSSCEKAPTPPSDGEVEAMTDLGQRASDALMKSLGGQLKGALQNGGPVEALVICQTAAIPLTDAASGRFDGARISRTTLRPRNPLNAPSEEDLPVLEDFVKQVDAATGPPQAMLKWHQGRAVYYRPLMIQEVCLNCHGDPDSFQADLTEKLAELYPADKATGYSLGDFRGVIRVEMDRKQP